MLPISLHTKGPAECGSTKATPQAQVELLSHSFPPKAEVEGELFLSKAAALLKAPAHLHQ